MLTRAADDLILGSALQVGGRMSSLRTVHVRARAARRRTPLRPALRRRARRAQVGARYRLPPEPAGQRPASLEQGEAAWRAAAAAAEADIGAGRCPSWARAPTLANCLMVAFQARPA